MPTDYIALAVIAVLAVAGGLFVLRQAKKRRAQPVKRRYTALELNAQCDLNTPMPDDLVAWDNMPPVRHEIVEKGQDIGTGRKR